MVTAAMKLKDRLILGRKVMTNLGSIFKSRDITLPYSQGYGFSSDHVCMWELDCEESWALKNWCLWTVVLEKTLFFFKFYFWNFTILYWFCQISKWICHRYTCVPHPEPSSLLPPHTSPLGHPSAPAPSIQYCALNLDWWLVSYMILYMFQCHLPNLPTLSLSHRVHKTVLYINVSFAVSYTGLLLPSF